MSKKIISTLLVFCTLVGIIAAMPIGISAVWDGNTEPYSGGDGTPSSPYKISNGAQLAYLAAQTNSGEGSSGVYFELTDDIDLGGRSWTPIGTYANGFAGNFDGKGHTISNLMCDSSRSGDSDGGIGLFNVKGGATVKNFYLKDVSIDGGAYQYVGAVTGYVIKNNSSAVNISNIYVTGSVCANGLVGGIVGGGAAGISSTVTVSNCVNAATVMAYESYAGGIVGNIRLRSICKQYRIFGRRWGEYRQFYIGF